MGLKLDLAIAAGGDAILKPRTTVTAPTPQAGNAPAGPLAVPRTLSVVMPALDEEASIERAVRTVIAAASAFDDVELIVVDDGSRDATADRVRALAAEDPRIRLIQHPSPRGFGASYDSGRRAARMGWTVMVQGDGPFSEETLTRAFSKVGEAECVCGYWSNPAERSWLRRLLSRAYTAVLNTGLGYRMRYYNGLQVHETSWLQRLDIESSGFGFQAEVLIAALRDGRRCLEVPTDYIERPEGGATKVFRLKNLLSVGGTLCGLLRQGWRRRPAPTSATEESER